MTRMCPKEAPATPLAMTRALRQCRRGSGCALGLQRGSGHVRWWSRCCILRRWRIRALGLSTLVGHPLFYWFVWAMWLPQPYENLALRLRWRSLGLACWSSPESPRRRPAAVRGHGLHRDLLVDAALFFSWMYFCNGGNTVWLASMAAMFLIYYHLTDWRIATLGSASGRRAGAGSLFEAFGPALPPMALRAGC